MKCMFIVSISNNAIKIQKFHLLNKICAQRKMYIQLCEYDKHLIYSVLTSEHSALLTKIHILVNMNILDITAEYLNIKSEYIISFLYS